MPTRGSSSRPSATTSFSRTPVTGCAAAARSPSCSATPRWSTSSSSDIYTWCGMRTTRTGRGPPAVRVLLRSAALVLGAAAAMLLLAQPASAHANLIRSDPPDGSVLAHAPSVARLWFSEEISPGFSSARVVDHTGAIISGSHSQAGGGDPRQLTVELPSLGTGTYGLVWRVLAEDDGHTTRGVVVFTVGAATAAGTSPVAASAGVAGTVGTAATPV